MFKYFGEESQFSLIGQGGTFVITVSRIYSAQELLWGSISPQHIACPHGIHGPPGSLPHFIFIVRSYSIFILQFSGSQLGGDFGLLGTRWHVWTHFWLSRLQRCYPYLVGGDKRYCHPLLPTQDNPTTGNDLSVNCATIGKLLRPKKQLLSSQFTLAPGQRRPACWQHGRVEPRSEQLLWKTATLLTLHENLEQSVAWKHLIWGVNTVGTKSQEPWAEDLGEFSHNPMLFTFFQTSPQISTLASAGHWLLTDVFKFRSGSASSQATKVKLTLLWPRDGIAPLQCMVLLFPLNSTPSSHIFFF